VSHVKTEFARGARKPANLDFPGHSLVWGQDGRSAATPDRRGGRSRAFTKTWRRCFPCRRRQERSSVQSIARASRLCEIAECAPPSAAARISGSRASPGSL